MDRSHQSQGQALQRCCSIPVDTSPLKLSNRRGTIATPLPSTSRSQSEPLAALSLGVDNLVYRAARQIGARVDLRRLSKLHTNFVYQALEALLTESEAAAEDIKGRLPRVWTSEVVFARQLDGLRRQCGYSRAEFDAAYLTLRDQGVIVRRHVGKAVQMRVCLDAA